MCALTQTQTKTGRGWGRNCIFVGPPRRHRLSSDCLLSLDCAIWAGSWSKSPERQHYPERCGGDRRQSFNLFSPNPPGVLSPCFLVTPPRYFLKYYVFVEENKMQIPRAASQISEEQGLTMCVDVRALACEMRMKRPLPLVLKENSAGDARYRQVVLIRGDCKRKTSFITASEQCLFAPHTSH